MSKWSGATSWQLLSNDRKILDPKLALTWENGRDYMTLQFDYLGSSETQDSSAGAMLPKSNLPVLSHWSQTTL